MIKNIMTFSSIIMLLLMLTGCNPDAEHFEYEIAYPSGKVITGITNLSEPFPIEGSELQMYTERIKDADYTMYIQNEDGEVLYTANGALPVNRGQVVDEELWICGESWSCVHYRQLLDAMLKYGTLYRIDVSTGEITFKETLRENELFLTINEGRCYFYHRGKASEEELFGLMATAAQNAEIYYRDISDWERTHSVYTFDYAGTPQEIVENSSHHYILGFSVQADKIAVALYSFEQIHGGEWGYAPVWSVDTPFAE